MIEFIPYFAGLITIVFGIGFAYAITDGWRRDNRKNN
jgi:hypothetical protein